MGGKMNNRGKSVVSQVLVAVVAISTALLMISCQPVDLADARVEGGLGPYGFGNALEWDPDELPIDLAPGDHIVAKLDGQVEETAIFYQPGGWYYAQFIWQSPIGIDIYDKENWQVLKIERRYDLPEVDPYSIFTFQYDHIEGLLYFYWNEEWAPYSPAITPGVTLAVYYERGGTFFSGTCELEESTGWGGSVACGIEVTKEEIGDYYYVNRYYNILVVP